MTGDRRGLTRVVAGSWLGVGAFLVARPEQALAVVGQADPPHALVVIARVLGARTAVQNVVVLAAPTRLVVGAGAAVDLTHALSMVAAALHWPAYRRAALASGALAAAAAILGRASAPTP